MNGVHYHFFTPREFDDRVKTGEFLDGPRCTGKARTGRSRQASSGRCSWEGTWSSSVDVQGVESFRRLAAVKTLS